jgi:hypothetical protein
MVAIRKRQCVVYVHHTRDSDGDVILYFRDMRICGGHALVQSSPIVSIRRGTSAVVDRQGQGGLGKYIITTQHTEYDVQMPHDRADHLARELRTRSA